MKVRTFLGTSALAVALVLGGGSTARAQDAQSCQPGLVPAFLGHQAEFTSIVTALVPQLGTLQAQLATVTSQATYAPLLATANALAASLPTGRVVMSLPDGTVVLDTSRADNVPGDPTSNSYANFQAKTINENHNSRMSFHMAQHYPCGLALESRLSSTTGNTESGVAVRLGDHLDAVGTVRMTVVAP